MYFMSVLDPPALRVIFTVLITIVVELNNNFATFVATVTAFRLL